MHDINNAGWLPPKTTAVLSFCTFVAVIGFVSLFAVLSAKPVMTIGGGVLAAAALAGILAGRLDLRALIPVPVAALVVCTALLVILSSLWSIYPEDVPDAVPRILGIGLAGIITIAYARGFTVQKKHLLLLWPLMLFLGLLLTFCLFQSGMAVQRWWRIEANAPREILNKGIAVLTAFLPVSVAVLLAYGRRGIAAAAVLSACAAFVVIWSESQSSLLALGIMAVSCLYPLGSKWAWRFAQVCVFVGVIAMPFVLYAAYNDGAAETLKQSALMRMASAPQRLEIWHAIAQKIMERPVLGYGYEATRHITDFQTQQIYQRGAMISHPHNMALQFWIEYGAIGAVLGAGALVYFLRRIEHVRQPSARRLYFVVYTSLLSVSMVGWSLWQGWWLALVFMVFAATAVCARTYFNQDAA